MADKNEQDKLRQETNAFVQDTLVSIAAQMQRVFTEALENIVDGVDVSVVESLGKNVDRLFKSAAKFSDKIAANNIKIKNGLVSSKDIEKQILDIEMKKEELAAKINHAKNLGVDISEENMILAQASLDQQKEFAEVSLKRMKANEAAMGSYGEVLRRLSNNRFFGSILDAKEGLVGMRKAADAGTRGFKLLGVGIRSAMAGLGPLTIALVAFNTLTKLFKGLVGATFKVGQYTTEFGRSLGISRNEAGEFRKEMEETSRTIEEGYKTTQEFLKASVALNEQFGTRSTELSQDLLDTFIETTKGIGLSESSAANIATTIQLMDVNAKDFYNTILGTAVATEALEGVSLNMKQVLEDTANVSAQTQLTFKSNNVELSKAIVLARRFGLNLNQVENIGGSLLDFESSISAELEAELVLQKDLNLNKARQAALDNDLVTLTQEIAKNLGSASEFERMNAIERLLFAKAVGMSVEELAKVLKQQQLLEDIGAKEADSMEKRLQLAIKRYGSIEKAKEALGEETYELLKQQSLQERFNNLILQSKEIFLAIAGPLADFTEKLTKNPKLMNEFVEKTQSFALLLRDIITDTLKLTKILVPLFKSIANVMMLPFKVYDLIFGTDEEVFKQANQAQMGISQSNSRIAKPVTTQEELPELATGGIVTQPTKALVGEAGAEAVIPLREFYAKMDELISVVKAGGDVYIDGNKAGQALVMSSYKS